MIKVSGLADPLELGYWPERITAIDSAFEGYLSRDILQGGSYCLSRNGKVFAQAAFGKLSYEAEDERLIQPDSLMRIASITKLFCATAIMKLVEDGKLLLNQNVSDVLEEFDCYSFKGIKIWHLLTHTSGLYPDGGAMPYTTLKTPWDYISEMKPGDTNWIRAAMTAGVRCKPDTEWAYCSFGYLLLGEIVSRISGMFANDYIVEHIAKPLGMHDTTFKLTPEQAQRCLFQTERAKNHLQSVIDGNNDAVNYNPVWNIIPSTGGGLYSTLNDLSIFGNMLLNMGQLNGVRILGRKAVEKMTMRATGEHILNNCWKAVDEPRAYGYGPDKRYTPGEIFSPTTYYHEGAGSCMLVIDPTEQFVSVSFTPFLNAGWHDEPSFHLKNLIWSGIM